MANVLVDVVIIGSGPGGYVAAGKAASLGKSVAVVERAEVGGICLNWGCIPTKSLISDAHLFHKMTHDAKAYGLEVDTAKLQWDKIVARSRGVSETLRKQVEGLFKKNKVQLFRGSAFVPRAGVVEVKNDKGEISDTITTKNILICTGAKNRQLPGIAPDGERVITSREAMVLKEIPKSMVIIGAGAIGVEFAYVYSTFGTKVTLVEMMDRILPIEDDEVSSRLAALLKKDIDIRVKHRTEKVERVEGGVRVTVTNLDGNKQSVIEAEKVLVAVGVTGNLDGLFAPSSTPELVKGHIKVGRDFQSSIRGIYAAGDVIGPPWLAHVASMEATIAIERMFNASQREMDYSIIPGCTYCYPQVASVGLTERACKEKNIQYVIGKWPFGANGRALAGNEADGFVKLIFSKDEGELLGAHLIGPEVTELLAELVLAKRLECTKAEIFTTIHAHPTLSESIMDAAAMAAGAAAH